MRFNRGVVIANWKLYPIPRSQCLKYDTLSNFWGLLTKPKSKINKLVLNILGSSIFDLSGGWITSPYVFYSRNTKIPVDNLQDISNTLRNPHRRIYKNLDRGHLSNMTISITSFENVQISVISPCTPNKALATSKCELLHPITAKTCVTTFLQVETRR